MNLQNILSFVSIWSVIIPLVIGLVWFNRLGRDSKLILGIVVLATIPQLIKGIAPDSRALIPAYNFYTVCEFLVYYLLFSNKFSITKSKKIHFSTLVVFSAISLFFVLSNSLMKEFISAWVCVSNFFYTVWILMLILDQYETETNYLDFNTPFIWYVMGLFYYSTCTFLIFSLWHYLKKNPESYLSGLWIIHHVFNTAMYILFSIGFRKSHNIEYATR
jgi:hypothetical protein